MQCQNKSIQNHTNVYVIDVFFPLWSHDIDHGHGTTVWYSIERLRLHGEITYGHMAQATSDTLRTHGFITFSTRMSPFNVSNIKILCIAYNSTTNKPPKLWKKVEYCLISQYYTFISPVSFVKHNTSTKTPPPPGHGRSFFKGENLVNTWQIHTAWLTPHASAEKTPWGSKCANSTCEKGVMWAWCFGTIEKNHQLGISLLI